MFGVRPDLGHKPVVVVVGCVAERSIALQHDHRRAVGFELVEDLTDALHRDHRRRVLGLCDTVRIWPTTSSWGTTRFKITVTATHASTIGTASRRIQRGNRSCIGSPATRKASVGASAEWALMRISPSRRSGRSRRWRSFRL
ncbi:hypothetical protein I553_2846 [Mycobacterium xenopi 4042]|uniref:Uncharacterized protein n=1 Tax=Mycobacterium xenopi 4042 TaxID=1299334 RepID=X8ECA9_MYCXE|nr:hypothetical protein I553_2846 [Mycobacterium xenopi 4042]